MSALELLRNARNGHSADRDVARDLLLQSGYSGQRVRVALAPYSPRSFDREIMRAWPLAIAYARQQRSSGARLHRLTIAMLPSEGFTRDEFFDMRERVQRAIESCVARKWLTRSKRGALCITRTGRAAPGEVVRALGIVARSGVL